MNIMHLFCTCILAVLQNAGLLHERVTLGFYSKEPLEVLNKDVRHFHETLACKRSVEQNLQDVFKWLYLRSDPKVRSKVIIIKCSFSQEEGPSKRSVTPRSSRDC